MSANWLKLSRKAKQKPYLCPNCNSPSIVFCEVEQHPISQYDVRKKVFCNTCDMIWEIQFQMVGINGVKEGLDPKSKIVKTRQSLFESKNLEKTC
jgi:transcription elongation factor Elf1